jgi:predicted nucleic acid-binding protein
MRTAVDTSVLIAIAKGEPDAEGELVICDVVASEFFAVLLDEQRFTESLQALGLTFDPTTLKSAQVAGRIFKEFWREGGPREHLVPDFLIGAHAQQQADRIAAIDRGYLRRYFPRLKILKPT